MLPIQSGVNMNLLGQAWQPRCLSHCKFKQYTKRPLLSAEGCHSQTLPDHSAELFVEGRRALKAVKALWGLISRPITDLGIF